MPDRIPLIEPVVGDEELSTVEDVLESGYLTQGPYTAEFEEQFADVVDATHAVATTSCTVGMELALDALGIGSGDEVIVPAFTYPSTATAVVRMGAEPVLVDVDRDTYTVDRAAIEAAISDQTAALLPVSWGGQPLPTDPITGVAAEHGLPVVEDAACSAGAAWEGDPVGSQFDVSVFSLHPRKVLTTGEGGVITTDNEDLAERIRSIKNFGTRRGSEDVEFVRADATNARMSDVLAAIGVAQIGKLDRILSRRRELAKRYTALLEAVDGVRAPVVPEEADHTFQTYGVSIDAGDERTRDRIITALDERDIETQIGTYALQETTAFADAKRVDELTTSKTLYQDLLTLPVAHSMTESDQRRVVDALEETIETVT